MAYEYDKPKLDAQVATNTTEPSSYAGDRAEVLPIIAEEESEVIKHESDATNPSKHIHHEYIYESESEPEPEPEEAKESELSPTSKEPADNDDAADPLQGVADIRDEMVLNDVCKEICRAKSIKSDGGDYDCKETDFAGLETGAIMYAVSDPHEMIVHSSTSPKNTAGSPQGEASKYESRISGFNHDIVLPDKDASNKTIPEIPQCESEGILKMQSDV